MRNLVLLLLFVLPFITYGQVEQYIYKGKVFQSGNAVTPPPADPTCNDGILNNGEEQIDCGGPNCQPCQVAPTCSDGIQNGNETGIDCGGPDCDPCTITNDLIVPTANIPELRFYVVSAEQTGPNDSPITQITELSPNPAPINTISGLTVNVTNEGYREFDYAAAGAFFEWGQPAKLDFQKATDPLTMLVVLGERRDPNNVGALLYKGDLSVGQGEFSMITSQPDAIYTRTWSGGGCCASTKGSTLLPYDVVAVTAAVSGASTLNRIYFNGVEATATTNYTHGIDAVFNTDWRSGVEWNQGATAFEYDGTIRAIMIFEKILTPTEMNNIRDEVLALGTPIPSPTCSDGIQNGDETGVDCGGLQCASCTINPTCSDGIQNGQETGVDCGGLCPPCSINPDATEVYVTRSTSTISKSPSLVSGNFIVNLASASGSNTDVNYELLGNAVNGTDYQTLSGVVTIPAGQTSANVTIDPINNEAIESQSTVVLRLLPGTGYKVAETYGINPMDHITITNSILEDLPEISGTSTITNLSDFTNGANAGTTATVTGSFDATGATAAAGMILVAGGGVISGTNINLNGSGIKDGTQQIFAPSARFNAPYELSRLRPEIFGANGNGLGDDHPSIVALMLNVSHATATPGATYTYNDDEIYIVRSGQFDWNMQGATLATTDGSNMNHGSTVDNGIDPMMDFANMELSFYNGTFDGNRLASRLFFFRDIVGWYMQDVLIEDYYSPPGAYARAAPFNIGVNDAYQYGYFFDSTVRNIEAATDGIANNSPFGVSKGFTFSVKTNNPSTTIIENCIIDGIYGDDAEGLYTTGSGGNYDANLNQSEFFLNNNQWLRCDRRMVKFNSSNGHVTNSYFESVNYDWKFSGAQAPLIGMFPISPNLPDRNQKVVGNYFKVVGQSKNALFAITEQRDSEVRNNVFEAEVMELRHTVTFGNGSNINGSESGFLGPTVVFDNNTLINTFIVIPPYFQTLEGPFVISNTTINLNYIGLGATRGVISRAFPQDIDVNQLEIRGMTVNMNPIENYGSNWSFLMTEFADFTNCVFEDITINYGGGVVPTYSFMRIGTNPGISMNNTNTINNVTINGDIGTGSIGYTGTFGAIITNSTGDGNTPITAIQQ